jgi:hypothetical protein
MPCAANLLSMIMLSGYPRMWEKPNIGATIKRGLLSGFLLHNMDVDIHTLRISLSYNTSRHFTVGCLYTMSYRFL